MEDCFKVNVKLTLEDLKVFSFHSAISNKILLIPSFVIIGFAINKVVFFGISFLILLVNRETFTYLLPHFFMYIVLPYLLAAVYIMLLGPVFYLFKKHIYNKKKSMRILQCISLTLEYIQVISSYRNSTYKWIQINKIKEMKSCFVVAFNHGEHLIIPRRCFTDEMQLHTFIKVIRGNVHPSKLQLKGYKLEKTSPDYGSVEYIQPSENEKALAGVLEFKYTKKFILKMSISSYYTSWRGAAFTSIGLYYLVNVFKSIIELRSFNQFEVSASIAFALFIPFIFFRTIIKQYEKAGLFINSFIYKLDEECLTVEYTNNKTNIKWTDFDKIKAYKNYYYFEMPDYTKHIIPKEALNLQPEVHKKLKEILARHINATSGHL